MLSEGKIRSLSVVIPSFNEEAILEKSLTALFKALDPICLDYEILVVDDGSTDRSPEILNKLTASVKGLKILRNSRNKGLGEALRRGFQEASKEVIFYIDADMPFQYSEVLSAVKLLEDSRAEGIMGFRLHRESEPLFRRLASAFFNLCVSGLYGTRMRDINCAFKLMKRDALRRLDLKAEGSFIDAEWMVRAAYKGYQMQEIGLEYHPRQQSRSRLFRFLPIARAFWEMIRFYPEMRRLKCPARQARSACR